MRVPTPAGQFRRLKYTDDGCSVYICCWCDRSIEVRDNPEFWNFCPKCGKSWFKRLQCRKTTTPRWYYDRFKGRESDKVKLFSGEVSITSLEYLCYKSPESKATWVFERRTKWLLDVFSKWEVKMRSPHDSLHEYKWAKSMLNYFRTQQDKSYSVESEYRVRLEHV